MGTANMTDNVDLEHINIDRILVDTEKLADVFCLTPRSVMRYVKEHGLPKHGRNRFELIRSIKWYVQHLVSRGAGGEDDSITEERRLLVKRQRQRIELEIQKRRGDLIDSEAVKTVLGQTATIYATHLESLASRLPATLAVIDEPAEIQKALIDESRAIRTATSAAFADFAAAYPGSRHPRTSTKKKRGRVGGRKKNTPARRTRARAVEN